MSRLKDDESEDIRKSAGNALRDISKKHNTLVRAELDKWNLENNREKYFYRSASKFSKAKHMKDYDNFFLPANNLDEAKKFYNQILGLPIKFDFSEAGMTAFKVGDQEPAIIVKDTKKFPATKPTIWFVVEDVQMEYRKLKEKGVVFLSEPFEIYTGLAAEFNDPFGNRLGITDYSKQKEK